jgi:sulfotransferase famil protein
VTIVNRQYNYIFIHVPKAAGKSVKQHLTRHTYGSVARYRMQLGFTLDAVGSYASARPGLNRLLPRLAAIGSDAQLRNYCLQQQLSSGAHLHAQQVCDLLGEAQYAAMYSFAVVRNPWDRCLSAYYYLRDKPLHPLHKTAGSLSFEGFVQAMESGEIPHMGQQALWLFDQQGQLMVNFCARMESISSDMAQVNDAIGLRDCPFQARTNVSEKRDRSYRKHYTEKAADIVARLMQLDIELFDYTY